MMTDVRDVHVRKVLSLIMVTLSGIVTDVSAVSSKAPNPIEIILVDITTDVSDEHERNA